MKSASFFGLGDALKGIDEVSKVEYPVELLLMDRKSNIFTDNQSLQDFLLIDEKLQSITSMQNVLGSGSKSVLQIRCFYITVGFFL